jgi:hypothetical protein
VRRWKIAEHAIKRRMTNRMGNILLRNCLLKHIIERRIEKRLEVAVRQERIRKQLLDDLKEREYTGK